MLPPDTLPATPLYAFLPAICESPAHMCKERMGYSVRPPKDGAKCECGGHVRQGRCLGTLGETVRGGRGRWVSETVVEMLLREWMPTTASPVIRLREAGWDRGERRGRYHAEIGDSSS